MSELIALDVAILPPPEVRTRALALSHALAGKATDDRLILDETHLPHITLTQQFIRRDELEAVLGRIDEVLRSQAPLTLRITGGSSGGRSVWMAIERTGGLVDLHERLMESLRGFERAGGTAAAFVNHDARVGDALWVAGYRLKSSFGAFTPHITIGPARSGSGCRIKHRRRV